MQVPVRQRLGPVRRHGHRAPARWARWGRIAHGYSDSAIARAADVFLKEKRKLILVPRETPWNLIQARNVVTLLEAGAEIIPAIPSFYHRPEPSSTSSTPWSRASSIISGLIRAGETVG